MWTADAVMWMQMQNNRNMKKVFEQFVCYFFATSASDRHTVVRFPVIIHWPLCALCVVCSVWLLLSQSLYEPHQ